MTRQPQAPESWWLLSGLPLRVSADQSQGLEPSLQPHGVQTRSALQSGTPRSRAQPRSWVPAEGSVRVGHRSGRIHPLGQWDRPFHAGQLPSDTQGPGPCRMGGEPSLVPAVPAVGSLRGLWRGRMREVPTTPGLVSQGQVPVLQVPIAQSGPSGEPDQSTQTYSLCLPAGRRPWNGPGSPDGVGAGGTKLARPWPLALVVGFSVLFPRENTQDATGGLAAVCQHPAGPGCRGLCTLHLCLSYWLLAQHRKFFRFSFSHSVGEFPSGEKRRERLPQNIIMMMAGHM